MKLIKFLMVGVGLFYAVIGIADDTKLKTYILAEKKAGEVAAITAATKLNSVKQASKLLASIRLTIQQQF